MYVYRACFITCLLSSTFLTDIIIHEMGVSEYDNIMQKQARLSVKIIYS